MGGGSVGDLRGGREESQKSGDRTEWWRGEAGAQVVKEVHETDTTGWVEEGGGS